MDLSGLLQRLGGRVAITFGIVSIMQIGFTPIKITKNANSWEAKTQLMYAITPDIEELIKHSVEVGIIFDIYIYADKVKYTYKVHNRLKYRTLTNDYSVNTSSGDSYSFKSIEKAKDKISSLNFVTDKKNIRIIKIKATLDIPYIEDKELIQSLWANETPRVSVILNKEKR